MVPVYLDYTELCFSNHELKCSYTSIQKVQDAMVQLRLRQYRPGHHPNQNDVNVAAGKLVLT